jgi:hypothetical protein
VSDFQFHDRRQSTNNNSSCPEASSKNSTLAEYNELCLIFSLNTVMMTSLQELMCVVPLLHWTLAEPTNSRIVHEQLVFNQHGLRVVSHTEARGLFSSRKDLITEREFRYPDFCRAEVVTQYPVFYISRQLEQYAAHFNVEFILGANYLSISEMSVPSESHYCEAGKINEMVKYVFNAVSQKQAVVHEVLFSGGSYYLDVYGTRVRDHFILSTRGLLLRQEKFGELGSYRERDLEVEDLVRHQLCDAVKFRGLLVNFCRRFLINPPAPWIGD